MLVPHPIGVPVPVPTPISAPFWDGCRHHELRYQRCSNGHAVFSPALVCRECASPDLTWATSAGLGRVYSHTTIWRPPTPEFGAPYVAAIVDLDEGYRMLANVVGCDHRMVRTGMPVEVEFHTIGEDFVLPYFAPAHEGHGVWSPVS